MYFGTEKKGITIIPDYLLERDGSNAWILDAKAPGENIDTGKNVEQAYSYAMHRDIRVELYALCNGRKLVVSHVTHHKPLIDIPLPEIERMWIPLLGLLGCRSAWPMGVPPGFSFDMGLALTKAGLAEELHGKKPFHLFMDVAVLGVARLSDEFYSLNALYEPEGDGDMMVTFDFAAEMLPALVESFRPELREPVRNALSRQPFQLRLSRDQNPNLMIAASIGDKTYTNENESYRPFVVEEFLAVPYPEGV